MSRLKSLRDVTLGIGTEVLFAVAIMAGAAALCALGLLLTP